MRLILAFPPRASATYVPLGIASLASYLAQEVPSARVDLLDLNVDLWQRLAMEDPEGQDLLDFLQGRTGAFLDMEQTRVYKAVWDRLRRRMAGLADAVTGFAEKAEADPGMEAMLKAQVSQILASDPEIIGFSILFPEQFPFAAALARAIKQETHCPIIFGGAMMSALSVKDLLTALPFVDAVVCGEGEKALAQLCSGADRASIPGLVHRTVSGIVENSKTQTLSLKVLPAPDFSGLNLARYFNPVPVLPVLFSRGCSWRKCRFCAHNFAFAGYRKKNVETFVAELEGYCHTLGVRHFYSADEFILPDEMDAIASEIKARGLDISYHVLGKPLASYTRERLKHWAESGCCWIGWGVESGSQRLLDTVNKGTRVPEIREVLKTASQAGISNMSMMIFGLPTSMESDMSETFRFLESVYDHIQALTASAFVLFDGTHFARNAGKYNLHVDGPLALLTVGGQSVRSRRLRFREISEDGSLRSPRGAVEVASWMQYRRWLGDIPLLEEMPSEHCLLHASKNLYQGKIRTPAA